MRALTTESLYAEGMKLPIIPSLLNAITDLYRSMLLKNKQKSSVKTCSR